MKKIKLFVIALIFVSAAFAKDYNDIVLQNKSNSSVLTRVNNNDIKVVLPDYIFENTNTKIELQFADPANAKLVENEYVLNFTLNGQDIPVQFNEQGKGVITHAFKSGERAQILFEDFNYNSELNVISTWMILAPFAIITLLITLRVLNNRAKKRVALKNLQQIDPKMPEPKTPAQKPAVKTEAEEEMLA